MKRFKYVSYIIITIITILVNFKIIANADNTDKIPQPPSGGPSMQGNFNVVGSNVPKQIYDKYNNVQIITNGDRSTKQAMWWKNKVNVNKPFTVKFYAYITSNDLNNVADGITFSLQNDKRKQINDNFGNPIKSNAIGTAGESLGAYGDVRSSNYYDNDYIKNDLSYEFDPYMNSDYSDNNLMDNNGNSINGQHTAFTTTDSTGINGPLYNNYLGNGYGFSQNHYDAHPLTDWPGILLPRWHKFIYNWTPNGDGTAKADVNIDDSNIHQVHTVNVNQILGTSNNDPYVWWGFTGSTGQSTMISAIADTAVTGDPGITKLVLDISKLSNDEKNEIKNNIINSDQSSLTKEELITCIDKPNSSPSDSDLSNILVSLIPSSYFSSTIKNVDVGDVMLYKVSIYNYKTIDGIGNDWTNVKVVDDNLSEKGMSSLDDKDNIDAEYDVIHPIDINSDSPKPSSVGLRTIINSNSNIPNPRNNIVTASGSNFYGDNIEGNNANHSSIASIYVNKTQPPIKSRVVINNQLTNLDNKNSGPYTLYDVSNYNSILYNVNLKNIVQGSTTSNNGTYSFWVPSLDNKAPDISINGQLISSIINKSSPYYTIKDNYDDKDNIGNLINKNMNGDKKKLITIYNLPSINSQNNLDIVAKIKLGSNNPSTFSSTPIYDDSKNYYTGHMENYNFDNGALFFNYINDIDYGIKDNLYINKLLSPLNVLNQNQSSNIKNGNYNIAQIYDSRRYKIPYSVYLSQDSTNNSLYDIGNNKSPFILHYIQDNNDNLITPNDSPIKIYNNNIQNNDNNVITNDINWNNENELKLGNNPNFDINHYIIRKGTTNYNAKLNWTIKDNGTP